MTQDSNLDLCNRCEEHHYLNDNGMCEDCQEILTLRDKVKTVKEQLESATAMVRLEPSALCADYGIQNCHFCENLKCDDNTSEAKRKIDRYEAALETIEEYSDTIPGKIAARTLGR